MKKLLIIGCALFLGAWEAHSEVIETVGYNPTRFGQYKRLKVSSGIELPAGLVSPNAVSQSGGSLTLEACQDGCTNPAYKINYLKASDTVQGNSTNFDVEKVTANSGSIILNSGGEISSAIGAGKVAVGQLEATTSTLVVGNSLKLGKGVFSPPSGRTDCQWVWESITHKDGTAKVLALKGCAGGSTPNPEPDPEPEPKEECTEQPTFGYSYSVPCSEYPGYQAYNKGSVWLKWNYDTCQYEMMSNSCEISEYEDVVQTIEFTCSCGMLFDALFWQVYDGQLQTCFDLVHPEIKRERWGCCSGGARSTACSYVSGSFEFNEPTPVFCLSSAQPLHGKVEVTTTYCK